MKQSDNHMGILTGTLKSMYQVSGDDVNTSVKSNDDLNGESQLTYNEINKISKANLKRKAQVEINLKGKCQVKEYKTNIVKTQIDTPNKSAETMQHIKLCNTVEDRRHKIPYFPAYIIELKMMII